MDSLTRANTALNSAPAVPDLTHGAVTPATEPTSAPAVAPSKYVPPHLRGLIPATTEAKVEKTADQVKLERKLQGLLNK